MGLYQLLNVLYLEFLGFLCLAYIELIAFTSINCMDSIDFCISYFAYCVHLHSSLLLVLYINFIEYLCKIVCRLTNQL